MYSEVELLEENVRLLDILDEQLSIENEEEPSITHFPSRFSIDANVYINFGYSSLSGTIVAVKFTESKVVYDVAVDIPTGGYTIFKEVDSVFINPSQF